MTAGADGSPRSPGPSEDTMHLALRLATMLERTRSEGQFSLEMFLMAGDRGHGGTLVIEVPSQRNRRGVVEMRFAAEGLKINDGVTAVDFRD